MGKSIMYRLDQISDMSPSGLDGKLYIFEFSTVPKEKLNKPEQDKIIRHHKIKILASRSEKSFWKGKNPDLQDDQNIKKVLFEEARRHLIKQLENGELEVDREILLDWGATCPYDPNKINMAMGAWYEVEIKTKIGFL